MIMMSHRPVNMIDLYLDTIDSCMQTRACPMRQLAGPSTITSSITQTPDLPVYAYTAMLLGAAPATGWIEVIP